MPVNGTECADNEGKLRLSGWYVTNMPIVHHKWICSVVATIARKMRGGKMKILTVLSFAMVVSQFSVASAATAQSPIVHIALTQDNLLRGQLVTRGGQPKSGVDISVSSGQDVICRATTDDQGVFAVKVARGGVYILSDGETSTVAVAWTKQAAPPSARNGVLLVSDEHVSRANLSSRPRRYTPRRYGPLETAAIIGAMGGVVYLAADDDDGS